MTVDPDSPAYLMHPDPIAWTPDDLGLRVTAMRSLPGYAAAGDAPPEPGPLLATWLTASDHLVRRTAFDHSDTINQLSFDQAFEAAVRNTRAATFELRPHARFARGFTVDAAQPSALLATPEVFEAARDQVDGELLVMAPTGGDVTLVGSDEPNLWLAFGYAAVEFAAGVMRALSPMLYRIVPAGDGTPARLDPWVPEPESPLHQLYRRARLTQLEAIYGPMMQPGSTFEFDGKPAAVAEPLWSYDADRDLLLSYCIWEPGYHRTLLPPTDCVAVNVKTSRAEPQLWVSHDELTSAPSVRATETAEFGPPVTVVGREDSSADPQQLLGELKASGGRTKARLGGIGEPAHVLDWVPSKNGLHGKRVTKITHFPGSLWT